MAKQLNHKKNSKRINTRKRTKIERKVREHNRKLRKSSKKGNKSHKKKKDPGVPNSFPFKEQVLKEAEDRKAKLEEERQRQKERQKKGKQRVLDKKRNLQGLVQDAQVRSAQFNKKQELSAKRNKENESGKTQENSLKSYYKEFRKVIEAADVVIQVLDARDPTGSRCTEVEETVMAAGTEKRLVLLLNKIDLVPKENVEKWLKYLRNEFPTVAFKASTQEQTSHLGHSRVPLEKASTELRQSSRCLGADMLMKLLGNYCRNKDIKTSITVGVVGFPNTGKSSIINSLKRSKACNVGAMPGITKTLQQVQLDKHIKLLDSPGIVMATGNSETQVILRNCVKIEAVEDPIAPVEAILKRCNKHKMMLQYNLPDYNDIQEFLAYMAKRLGKLKKGGIPDINKAARTILQDWNTGKIRYYTEPPETVTSHVSAEFVTSMSKEFDIDGLLAQESESLKELKTKQVTDMVIESVGPVSSIANETELDEAELDEAEMSEEDDSNLEEDENMEGDEEMKDELENVVVSPSNKKRNSAKLKAKALKEKVKVNQEMNLKGNLQLNKEKLKNIKKIKKKRKKADKVAGKLSDALEGAFAGLGQTQKDYDFKVDFK